MVSISRRSAMWIMALVAAGAGLNTFLERQGNPPTEAWVRERLWGDDLLAYAVWDGEPRAVLRIGNRIRYDLMVPGDWFWPNWPPAPQWQLAGIGYSIADSDMPATLGFAPCLGVYGERCGRPIELFGKVNDPAIVAMDVLAGDAWLRYAVAAPGFAVRLDGVTTAPSGYRWLDTNGNIVRETGAASPTKPGHRKPFRRGRRNRATPAPASSAANSLTGRRFHGEQSSHVVTRQAGANTFLE